MDVQQRGRRGVRDLRDADAGQPVAEQVGDEQHRPRGLERRRAAGRCQLVDGVERQELEAGPRVELGARHDLVDWFHGRRRPVVAVVIRLPEQPPLLVQQPVVDAPRIDPDADRTVARPGDLAQSAEDLVVEPQDVPVEPVGQPHRVVREAADLGQLEGVRADPADHHPAARRAEIDGRDEPGGHRRKAAATPASTGMCNPVVWLRSPPVSAKTAAATCSGTTSRLSSVRCA